LGIAFIPYFPLASGLLTGKYRRGEPAPPGTRLSAREQVATDERFDIVEALESYGRERGVPLLHVAIGALLARGPVASVIAGATSPEQVQANASAASWQPSPEDIAELEKVLDAV
jgi:aryl-alcohol dehydrogenase-like predicted oxidoreductase